MYAKLTPTGIEYAPQNKGNVLNFGLKSNEAQLLALGYLPVVDGEIPEAGENQTLNPVFTQEKGRIVRGFEVVDLPPDPMQQQIDEVRETAEDTAETLHAFLEGFGGEIGE